MYTCSSRQTSEAQIGYERLCGGGGGVKYQKWPLAKQVVLTIIILFDLLVSLKPMASVSH